jgi:hypothetical protein
MNHEGQGGETLFHGSVKHAFDIIDAVFNLILARTYMDPVSLPNERDSIRHDMKLMVICFSSVKAGSLDRYRTNATSGVTCEAVTSTVSSAGRWGCSEALR